MHISVSFLCQMVPDSRYRRYDEHGQPHDEQSYSRTYSLLPIVSTLSAVEPGATLWLLSEFGTVTTRDVERARDAGARIIVCAPEHCAAIDELPEEKRSNLELIILPDTEQALLSVASVWRQQSMLPIVAITGSVGKTTTKHMLATIFAQDNLPVFFSSGQQNTLTGIARNILHLTGDHVAGIFEVGIHHKGDMEQFVRLLQPTMGVITSVSAAHLKGLGSVQEVALEKRALFSQFSPSQIGIVCGDYPHLAQGAYQHPVVRFGLKYKNMVTAKRVTVVTTPDGRLATRCVLRLYDQEKEIQLPGNHVGLLYAALAATTVSYFLHTPFEVIAKGLQAFIPIKGCFELQALRDGRGTVVNDCATANPESMKAALHAVHTMKAPQKIAVLGDMLELGTKQFFWHRHVGRELIKTRSIKQLVLVGELAHQIGPVAPATMDVACVTDWREAHEAVDQVLAPEDNLVLVKGARSLRLDNLVDRLI